MSELILATDLDGTFLEGSPSLKQFIYNELLKLKNQMTLIYVTGRDMDSIKYFCANGYLPMADFIIGDHGTQIASGHDFKWIGPLQEPIVTKWNAANAKIKALLANDPGIELQPINPPYRVAYYYDSNLLQHETIQKISNAGFDPLLSCGMYLDILPKGINKGSSLLRLIDHMRLDKEAVITCGDSLNDLSLFQTGLRSIVVGNADDDLLLQTRHLTNVYHSQHDGLLGILEGLKFYNKHHLFQFAY